MKSPKAEFLSNRESCVAHTNLTEQQFLARTHQVALLEMLFRLGAPDANAAAANAMRLDGAKMFLSIWENLGTRETTTTISPQILNYEPIKQR